MRRLPDAWRSLAREFGPKAGLLYLAHRVLERLSGGAARIVPYVLYAQPVGTPQAAAVRDDPATVVQRLEPGDPLERDFPRPADVVQSRYATGAECFAAVVKGAFAGHIWIASGRYDEDEVRCEYVIDPDALGVWDFDVYVVPALRMGRTMARLWKAVDLRLSERGVKWSFSRISAFNPASLASHRRLGAVPIGRATFVVIGRLQLAITSQRPFVHVSGHAASRPRLRLLAPPC